jgi:queuine tRNA-ribosyltransferase
VGETKAQREDFTELTARLLPQDYPRYLMGVGTPIDLLEGVHRGVDMFDCVLPTLLAQQGVVFTSRGRLDLRRGVYKFSEDRLDPDCGCSTCVRYSRGYLSHLIKAKEVFGWMLLGTHNLAFYLRLMREIRQAILAGRFIEFYHERRGPLGRQVDEDHPTVPPVRKKKPSDDRPLARGDYAVEVGASGLGHIRQRSSRELMHPVDDPREEAFHLYVESSGLGARLAGASEGESVCVWDIGLGAATNAMAAIREWEKNPRCNLMLESFERDLDPLRLATDHPFAFPHVKHAAPYLLLRDGHYRSKCGKLTWVLNRGDFEQMFYSSMTKPDYLFYDPFSAKTEDSPLWRPQFFERLYAKLYQDPAIIVSYSNSTALRAAWLSAGFYVASGAPSARRKDTSLILTEKGLSQLPSGAALLGRDWLERWKRSSAQAPLEILEGPSEGREAFFARVEGHSQFRKVASPR